MREACENNNDLLLGSDKKTAVSTGKECREGCSTLSRKHLAPSLPVLQHYNMYTAVHAILGSYMYINRDGTPLCAVKLTIYKCMH